MLMRKFYEIMSAHGLVKKVVISIQHYYFIWMIFYVLNELKWSIICFDSDQP